MRCPQSLESECRTDKAGGRGEFTGVMSEAELFNEIELDHDTDIFGNVGHRSMSLREQLLTLMPYCTDEIVLMLGPASWMSS
jgi:hypothetical protein